MFQRLNQWFSSLFPGKENLCPSCPAEQAPTLRWLAPQENPFGIEILDCRPFALRMVAVTGDPEIAARFLQLRNSFGEELRGVIPKRARAVACSLAYPYQGEIQDGALFKAREMEDKWDIYLYEGYLYFSRSWTGELIFRARMEFTPEITSVTAIETASPDEDFFIIQQVDYLIRSHLFKRQVPHPLPKNLGRDAQQLALYSFSQYGRRGLYGSFSNTLAAGR